MSAVQPSDRPSVSYRYLRIGLWSLAVLILAVPAIAMQFTSEMNWGFEDFLAAALLIGGSGLATEAGVRVLRTPAQRGVVAGAVIVIAALLWAELAVGLLH